MNRSHDNLPDEFQDIATHLERERPELSALELDGVKRRVMSRTPRGTTHGKGSFMKSRLALVSMLAAGLLMSGTGATLAVDGLTASQNAATAQYGGAKGEQPGGDVLGDVIQSEEGAGKGAGEGAAGDVREGAGAAQPTRQVERGAQGAGAGELPFTGYAGITMLLLGLALLSAGLVLRRTTRQS